MVDVLEGTRFCIRLRTTGISTNNDRIVQIALIGADVDGSPIHYEVQNQPAKADSFRCLMSTGIYDSDVRTKPIFKNSANEIAQLMNGAVVVGHNARKFDMPLLENEFYRCGVSSSKPEAILDTLEAVRRLKIARPHNLGAQCARHGIDLSNAHDAAADAAASLLLLWKLMRDHPASFRRSISGN